jgi:hypothetical protein
MVASMKAAFDKVGGYPREIRVFGKLVFYLQKHDRDLMKAMRAAMQEIRKDDDLLLGCLLACGRSVLADMDNKTVGVGSQMVDEPQALAAPPPAATTSTARPNPRMKPTDALASPATASEARPIPLLKPNRLLAPPARHTSAGKPPKMPTASQKKAELAVARTSAFDLYKIRGRAIGNLTMGSLRAEMAEAAAGAASGLRHGLHQTMDFLLMRMIDAHCVVVNNDEIVRNVITEKDLIGFQNRTSELAPKMIAKGIKMYTDNLPRLIEGELNANH